MLQDQGKKATVQHAANNLDTIRRYDMEHLTDKTKGRSPVIYEYGGVRKTVKEWSEFLGLDTPQAFYMRLMALKKGDITQAELFAPAAPQSGHRKKRRKRRTKEHSRRIGD